MLTFINKGGLPQFKDSGKTITYDFVTKNFYIQTIRYVNLSLRLLKKSGHCFTI